MELVLWIQHEDQVEDLRPLTAHREGPQQLATPLEERHFRTRSAHCLEAHKQLLIAGRLPGRGASAAKRAAHAKGAAQ